MIKYIQYKIFIIAFIFKKSLYMLYFSNYGINFPTIMRIF